MFVRFFTSLLIYNVMIRAVSSQEPHEGHCNPVVLGMGIKPENMEGYLQYYLSRDLQANLTGFSATVAQFVKRNGGTKFNALGCIYGENDGVEFPEEDAVTAVGFCTLDKSDCVAFALYQGVECKEATFCEVASGFPATIGVDCSDISPTYPNCKLTCQDDTHFVDGLESCTTFLEQTAYPTESQDMTAPTDSPEMTAPTESPQMTAPTEFTDAAPTETPDLTAPTDSPISSQGVQTGCQTFAIAFEVSYEALPTELEYVESQLSADFDNSKILDFATASESSTFDALGCKSYPYAIGYSSIISDDEAVRTVAFCTTNGTDCVAYATYQGVECKNAALCNDVINFGSTISADCSGISTTFPNCKLSCKANTSVTTGIDSCATLEKEALDPTESPDMTVPTQAPNNAAPTAPQNKPATEAPEVKAPTAAPRQTSGSSFGYNLGPTVLWRVGGFMLLAMLTLPIDG